jgi:hypothetical protein
METPKGFLMLWTVIGRGKVAVLSASPSALALPSYLVIVNLVGISPRVAGVHGDLGLWPWGLGYLL